MEIQLDENWLSGDEASKSAVRFIVQISVNKAGWEAYKSRGSRSARYTLTQGEAEAFMATLPATVKVWTNVQSDTGIFSRERVEVSAEYRVIKSVKEDGLVNQSVVA